MNRYLTVISLIALFQPFCANAAKPLENFLPANTSIIVGIDNFDRLDKECVEGPVGNIINNEQIRNVLRPVTDKYQHLVEDNKDKMIISWNEIRERLGGQIVLGINLDRVLSESSVNTKPESLPGIYLLANVKDGESFTHLIVGALKEESDRKDSDLAEKETESFMGEDIHHFFARENASEENDKVDDENESEDGESENETAAPNDSENSPKTSEDQPKGSDFYFGNVKDTFFATISVEDARAAVEAIKGDEKGTLAEELRLSEIHSLSENYDTYLYVYAKPYADFFEKLIRDEMKKNDDNSSSDPSKPNADAIINALGLSSFKSLTAGVKFEQDYVKLCTDLQYDSSFGISRVFRALGDNYPTPDFVKDSTARSISSSGFNASSFVSELKSIVFAAYPMGAMLYQMQAAQFQQKCGVNIDTDILGGFDEGFSIIEVNNPDQTQNAAIEVVPVYAFKLKDSETFKRNLSSMIAILPPPVNSQTSDYNGNQIISIASPNFSVFISTKDGWLLVSSSSAALQGTLATNKDDKSFWQGSRYKDIVCGRLALGGVSVSYSDFDIYIRAILNGFASGYNKMTQGKNNTGLEPIDANLIPAVKDLPLAICGKCYKTADGLHSETYLVRK